MYPHTFLHRFDAATDELCLENEPRDLFTEQNFQKFSQMCAWFAVDCFARLSVCCWAVAVV